ncbi:smalltalk protein [Parabacteroides sp.]|nr:smalltalk protein [Parabacteroides sp.]
MDNKSSKIDWMKILQVVAQAFIAALTALGVSSCVANL